MSITVCGAQCLKQPNFIVSKSCNSLQPDEQMKCVTSELGEILSKEASDDDRRFIEDPPCEEVGLAASKEKSILKVQYYTCTSGGRAAHCCQSRHCLCHPPAPKDIEEWQRKRDFIIELSKWKLKHQVLLEKARRMSSMQM